MFEGVLSDYPLKFYNTETRQKEALKPLHDGKISMYTCGPTVYDYAHIGNFRTYIFEDLLRRTLKFFGLQVKQVMNLTDVDDKTIRGALAQGVPLEEYTKPFKDAFFEDLKTLNIEAVEHYPAATDYISQMIAVIQALLDKGVAYQGNDGSVYYSITKFSRYGCLSHLNLDELQTGASARVNADEYDKDNVSDFALWKRHDPERDGEIFWDGPFGPGRPGWHLECSTMAMELLGDTIDIHCGGVDNIFPHHENEVAQSEAVTGKRFVGLWLHSEHLIVDNKKMSKSLGNFFTLRDLVAKGYTGRQVRYMLLHTHYRQQLNFTMQELDAVDHSLQRLADFIQRMTEVSEEGGGGHIAEVLERAHTLFAGALADDLNISAALAAVFDMVRDINVLCDGGKVNAREAQQVLALLRNFDTVLGVFPFDAGVEDIPQDLQDMLQQRQQARKEKDWALSDKLRDAIQGRGYVIEDTASGARLKKVRTQ